MRHINHNHKNQRILVTGGAGFIGSNLIFALNQRGITNILVVDNLNSDNKWKNLVGLKFDDYVESKVFRQNMLTSPNIYGKFNVIFHLGACSSTAEVDAAYLIDNNFTFTKELSLWALKQNARFIYASSAATYGNDSGDVSEDKVIDSLRPLNMYAYSKHLFDVYAMQSKISDKIVGLKYFNVFGPNEDHKKEMRSFVWKAYQEIKKDGTVIVYKSKNPEYKDGEQARDFIYVKDAVDITIHFSETTKEIGGLYNVGTGKSTTYNALARAVFNAYGRLENIQYVGMPEEMIGNYQYLTRANLDKLHEAGYTKSLMSIDEAVDDYVKNYLIPGHKVSQVSLQKIKK